MRITLSIVVVASMMSSCATVQTIARPFPTDDETACAELRSAYGNKVRALKALELSSDIGQSVMSQMATSLVGGSLFGNTLASKLDEELQGLIGDVQKNATATADFAQSFNAVYDCRAEAARQINRDFRGGAMSRDEANALIDAIRVLAMEDVALARQLQAEVAERNEAFRLASREARQAVAEAPAADRAALDRDAAALDEQVQTNQRVYQASVERVQTAETEVGARRDPFPVVLFDGWRPSLV